MSRTGTLTAAAMMAVTVALCAAGCGIGWQDLTISQVSVGEEDRTLTVGWHCHEDSSVTVEETPDEVRLRLRAYSYRGDCAEGTVVTLQEPLGDRTVIDATTGTAVEPCTVDDMSCF